MAQAKQVQKTCERCGDDFLVRQCYLDRATRRGQRAGRYCSVACRRKPELLSFTEHSLRREPRAYQQKKAYAKLRLEVLTLLSSGKPECERCGCPEISILEVNHRRGGGNKHRECGARLWRAVRHLGVAAKEKFNVLCKICNQADYVSRQFGLNNFHISWSLDKPQEWIAVDFDGTLATWGCPWNKDYSATGSPIPKMIGRVKKWLSEGKDVRIFTARADQYHPSGTLSSSAMRRPLEAWCLKHLGQILPITNRKDYWCRVIYDDRAIQVIKDTGELIEKVEA